jgi:DNA-binding NarL/FixJ family response regulator
MGIRIVIAEDHYLIREGLAGLLSREPNAVVVAHAENRPELGMAIATHRPDVVATDIRTGAAPSGSEGRAYLLKERLHDGRDLMLAIEAVHGGASVIDPQVIDAPMRVQERKRASILDELTAREREVLAHLAQGRSNGAIAEALVLTKRAVESTSTRSSPSWVSPSRRASARASRPQS